MNSKEAKIVGIVNVTPDSFSDGGTLMDLDVCLHYIEKLIQDGADIIDMGAESTRPGASLVSIEEERARIEPILKVYKKHFDTPLSVDTMKSDIARLALDYGASMINDVTGLTSDSKMIEVLSKYDCSVVIMHMQNRPKNMQDNPSYEDVVSDVLSFFKHKIEQCQSCKISNIILDPGIGFGKTVDHNLSILRHMSQFSELGYPLYIGTSRKSFIDKLSPSDVDNRVGGTISSNILAWMNGAEYFRVHDVFDMKQAFRVARAILEQ
ncbi:dihydropteroate synthase [Candidatus Marinamargulisbacteria bacterium SCGC AG-343-D04]|nr:dihydropteroate synthase [Candidatus Marinamargulisbacteria bacterium SCGC AG-343-D04]